MTSHPSPPQHLTALALANRVRLGGAAVKRDLATGTITVHDALNDPRAGCLTIGALLSAQYRWGPFVTARILRELHISETRRVRDLTARQREQIAAEAAQRATRIRAGLTENSRRAA